MPSFGRKTGPRTSTSRSWICHQIYELPFGINEGLVTLRLKVLISDIFKKMGPTELISTAALLESFRLAAVKRNEMYIRNARKSYSRHLFNNKKNSAYSLLGLALKLAQRRI